MSNKKCKGCGETSERMWVCDDELFCECCLCTDFGIHEITPPRRCEQCGTPIRNSYFIDNEEDDAFCSIECALAYWDAVRYEEDSVICPEEQLIPSATMETSHNVQNESIRAIYDPIGWAAIEAGLDEIVRITKERGK